MRALSPVPAVHPPSSASPLRPAAATDSSATAVLDEVLQRSLALGASDLHLEPGGQRFVIRCRVDGLLRVVATPPLALKDALITRVKVLARMDIAEKRLPQDGRMRFAAGARAVDLRVSSLPTMHGEKLVLRVLDSQHTRPALAELGCEDDELARLHRALGASDGMLLMTGPTGSGKTQSLYACLDWLNRPEVNIATLEDPVEIEVAGINQVNLNERAGLGFANSLRALLRQDPDILMLGEIRDLETAEMALQAAQTGHLVLSTLHTPDAPSTLARLQHMGVAAHHVAASVRLIVAQRLLRRLCGHCRRPMAAAQQAQWRQQLREDDRRALAPWLTPAHALFDPVGCAHCHAGYAGRVGVFQVMPVSDALQRLLFEQADRQRLAAQAAQESVRTLRQSAWAKALQGVTSVAEVLAHTGL